MLWDKTKNILCAHPCVFEANVFSDTLDVFLRVTSDMYTLDIRVAAETHIDSSEPAMYPDDTAPKVKFWKPIFLHSPVLLGKEGRSFLRM